jgi:hypothetical protein
LAFACGRAATAWQRRIVTVSISVVIVALALSGLALWQRREAVSQFVLADQAKKEALAQRDRALSAEDAAMRCVSVGSGAFFGRVVSQVSAADNSLPRSSNSRGWP